jgi:hypothetical protein
MNLKIILYQFWENLGFPNFSLLVLINILCASLFVIINLYFWWLENSNKTKKTYNFRNNGNLDDKLKNNKSFWSLIFSLFLNLSLACADKGSDGENLELSKDKDESKILDEINENVIKSSIFDLDELLTWFETLNGISKLACTMIFTSSFILWSLFGIMLNLYGNYLLDRFNLEERYPKIAIFIKYRRKLSKYYIMSNFLLILGMCLMNMILGLMILSL